MFNIGLPAIEAPMGSSRSGVGVDNGGTLTDGWTSICQGIYGLRVDAGFGSGRFLWPNGRGTGDPPL